MREVFDLVVVGFGPAACLFARAVAAAGGRVAMIRWPRSVRNDASDWIDYWLIPRDEAEVRLLSRLGVAGDLLDQLAVQTLNVQQLDVLTDETTRHRGCRLVAVEDFRQPCREALELSPNIELFERLALDQYLYEGERIAGVQAIARNGDLLQLAAPLVVDTTRACSRVDVRPTEYGLFDAVVWGRYFGISREAGLSANTALTFRGRGDSRFWMLPVTATETHLGVEVTAQPAGRLCSAAQLWEDELVGCPALADRMMDAALLEACELQRIVYPHGPGAARQGLVALDEIDAPTPLAFRWAALVKAAQLADSVVSGIASRRQLAGG